MRWEVWMRRSKGWISEGEECEEEEEGKKGEKDRVSAK